MAVSQENEKLAEIYIKSAENSPLSLEEQAAWIESINSCKIATNGLSQQEKIQKMSENTLRMIGRMLYDRVETVKVNQEFRKLNGKITDDIAKISDSFTEKFKQLNDKSTALEKKIDENFSVIESKITVLADHLLQNSKDTYKLVGKDKSKDKSGWLSTLLNGLDKLKWAIVTLGGILIMAITFKPQVAEGLEQLLKHFTH